MLAAVGTLPRTWAAAGIGDAPAAVDVDERTPTDLTAPPAPLIPPTPPAAKRSRRVKADPLVAAEATVAAPGVDSPPSALPAPTGTPEAGVNGRAEPRTAGIPEPPLWVRLAAPPEPVGPAPAPADRAPAADDPGRGQIEPVAGLGDTTDSEDGPPLDENRPLAAMRPPAERGRSSRAVEEASGGPEWPTSRPELRPPLGPSAPTAAMNAVTWPPVDDRQLPPATAIRTPAGSYLAPSAVLPPLDAPLASRNGHGPLPADPQHDPHAGAVARTRASFAESLEALGIPADMPRRLVGGGAAMAVLGFLLPWVNALGGGGALIDNYLSYWGLAGPGHWIVACALLVLVAVAFAGRPFDRIRVGAIAVATAALLVGLLWTYLFGVPGKSVGVWIVLAGAALIAIGGTLDLRRRHAVEDPTV